MFHQPLATMIPQSTPQSPTHGLHRRLHCPQYPALSRLQWIGTGIISRSR
jgi:hypothetical protein